MLASAEHKKKIARLISKNNATFEAAEKKRTRKMNQEQPKMPREGQSVSRPIYANAKESHEFAV